jgi:hypothetical protein
MFVLPTFMTNQLNSVRESLGLILDTVESPFNHWQRRAAEIDDFNSFFRSLSTGS